MPLNSTQFFIRDLLDELPVPGNTGSLRAFITPLSPDDNDEGQPTAFIWPSNMAENRRAMPRNRGPSTPTSAGTDAGWKNLRHDLDIWLVYPAADDGPDADSAFPGVIDAVMDALRTAPNPAPLADPLTGMVSQIIDCGEQMRSQMDTPQALMSQRWTWYAALITLQLLELLQR